VRVETCNLVTWLIKKRIAVVKKADRTVYDVRYTAYLQNRTAEISASGIGMVTVTQSQSHTNDKWLAARHTI